MNFSVNILNDYVTGKINLSKCCYSNIVSPHKTFWQHIVLLSKVISENMKNNAVFSIWMIAKNINGE
jgi:hypothetical protein